MNEFLTLTPGHMTLNVLRNVWRHPVKIQLPPQAYKAIASSANAVQEIVSAGAPAYGINTGFGKLAKSQIANHQLEELQRNLILSHSVGTGELMSDEVVRLILVTKIASLARGFSGI